MRDTQSGFDIRPAVLTPDEAGRLLADLEALSGRSRAGARHLMNHPAVAAIARDPRLRSLAREALGSAAIPYRATLFDKSPISNWLVAWHQDTALPLKRRRDVPGWGPWSLKSGVLYANAPASALQQVVALRIHLDDSLQENGPLRVLPGTHTLGVLPHRELESIADRIEPHECTVPRGGVIAIWPLLVHASSKSRMATPRRVLHIEYAPTLLMDGGLELDVA